jgi:hypothetical protein
MKRSPTFLVRAAATFGIVALTPLVSIQAFLSSAQPAFAAAACSDGVDSDGDQRVDTLDPGCHSDGNPYNAASYLSDDSDESWPPNTQCNDAYDDDHDGVVDYPADPDCSDPMDNSESGTSGGSSSSSSTSSSSSSSSTTSSSSSSSVSGLCSDGLDNDSDQRIDAQDPGCHSDGNPYNMASYVPADATEGTPANSQCNDAYDDDHDGLTDYPADPDCVNAMDNSESGTSGSSSSSSSSSTSSSSSSSSGTGLCSDGLDNDQDTRIDMQDPGCHSDGNPYNAASYVPADMTEGTPANSQCNDGYDDDHDGVVDYPADPDCSDAMDNSESGTSGGSSSSSSSTSSSSSSTSSSSSSSSSASGQCSDGVDNDSDGRIDAVDPGCHSDGNPHNASSYVPSDMNEASPANTQCNDGVDNDGDGQMDYGMDPGCASPMDNNETDMSDMNADLAALLVLPPQINRGDLLPERLTAKNNGPSPSAQSTFTQTIPAGFEFNSTYSNPKCRMTSATTVTCDVPGLEPGAAKDFMVYLRVPTSYSCNTTLPMSATLTPGAATDPSMGNNTSNSSTWVTCG